MNQWNGPILGFRNGWRARGRVLNLVAIYGRTLTLTYSPSLAFQHSEQTLILPTARCAFLVLARHGDLMSIHTTLV